MEDLEKQFFSSYESYLAKEGKEICKEFDSIIKYNDELMIEHFKTYYHYFFKNKKCSDLDPKFVEKCVKFYEYSKRYDGFKQALYSLDFNKR